MKLIIEDDEGRRTVIPFVGDALSIGRLEGNHVLLSEKNVSRKHGRIYRNPDGRFFIEDLDSFTGIRVNGERIKKKRTVKAGDLIQISEYDLSLQPSPDELKEDEKGLGDDADDEPTAVRPPAAPDDVTATSPSLAPLVADADGTFDTPTAPQLKAAPAAAEAPTGDAPAAAAPTGAAAHAAGSAVTAEMRAAARSDAAAAPSEPRTLAGIGLARLVGLTGAFRGREWTLAGEAVSIGRAPENAVVLDHPSVSRVHARLAFAGGAWKFVDTGSKNGLLLNGAPYLGHPLLGGETVELGHLKFAFVAAGQPFTLPTDVTQHRGRLSPRSAGAPLEGGRSKAGLAVLAVAVLALATVGAVVLVRRESKKAARLAAVAKTMQAAAGAVADHRYVEALPALAAARAAGATEDELRPFERVQLEASAEQEYRALDKAMTSGDLDNAQAVALQLAGKPTWFASLATGKAEAIKGSYVKAHLARAAEARGKDAALCTAQVNLVLGADAQNAEAAALAPACSLAADPAADGGVAADAAGTVAAAGTVVAAPGAAPAAAAPPPSAELAAAAAAAAPADAEARRLLVDGNQRLIAAEFPAAIAAFQRVVSLKPDAAVLGPAYRSLGIAYMRQGNTEEGTRYYRLYLPLCTVPKEREALQKTLEQYDASRAR